MRPYLALLAGLLLATSAHALSLADISGKDAGGGLKEALTQGAGKAVALLGKQDGFLEFLKGQPLTKYLEGGQKMPYTRVVDIMVSVMKALVVASAFFASALFCRRTNAACVAVSGPVRSPFTKWITLFA